MVRGTRGQSTGKVTSRFSCSHKRIKTSRQNPSTNHEQAEQNKQHKLRPATAAFKTIWWRTGATGQVYTLIGVDERQVRLDEGMRTGCAGGC